MKVKNFFLCSVIMAGLMLVVIPVAYASEKNDCFVKNLELIKEETERANNELSMRDSLEQMLLDSVYDYVENRSPKMAPVVAELMVDAALDKDFDICFMMAQTLIETAFGQCGVGQTRKSIFGVKKEYDTYEDCIHNYVELVQNRYLGADKTIEDLLRNYVTVNGSYRYCSSREYESKLRRAYDLIVENTHIKQIQDEIRQLKD